MTSVNQVGSAFLRCILQRMKDLGVTQTELAKRMNASRPYVIKALHGQVNISFESAARFARALKMDFCPELALRPIFGSQCEEPEPLAVFLPWGPMESHRINRIYTL